MIKAGGKKQNFMAIVLSEMENTLVHIKDPSKLMVASLMEY